MNIRACLSLLTISLSGFALMAVSARAAEGVSPPDQALNGPGGAAYTYGGKKVLSYGEGDTQYWLFEPINPTPKSCPVIIFNHGWSAMEPAPYDGWIEHLVRRGNIVIYPRYQADLLVKGDAFVNNAAAAVKDALTKLAQPGHVKAQTDKVAAVGHSAGGLVAAGLAVVAQSKGLPPIKAVMCVEPGKSWGPPRLCIPLQDMSKMPASTLLLTVFGEQDQVAKDIDARRIYNETRAIPKANKNCVELLMDDHGTPALIASHFCPISPSSQGEASRAQRMRRMEETAVGNSPISSGANVGHSIRRQYFREALVKMRRRQPGAFEEETEQPAQMSSAINALDYYGLWKLFDGLTDAAFFGKNRQYALGNTPEMRYMGKWSDGVPVKELKVIQ